MQSPIHNQAELPSRGRVLAICAHPDDIESWCGGTLALLVERGCEVRLAICTAGEKGSDDRRMTTAQVAETRISEQRAAAARLGITAVRFLDGKDGERVWAKGAWRDPTRSSHSRTVVKFGHKWLVLCVLVPVRADAVRAGARACWCPCVLDRPVRRTGPLSTGDWTASMGN